MYWIFDFLINGNLSLGFIFIIYIWILFLIRWYFARKYKPYVEPYYEPVSVIIPVYNENFRLFKKCLLSIKREKPEEIIVVVNGGGENEPIYVEMAEEIGARVFTLPEAGKRPAVALGIRKAKHDIVVVLDSYTVFTKGALKEMLKPFKDPKMGGVVVTQMIINSDVSIVRKFAGWMEDMRFAINHRAQSHFRSVGCLPGRAIAFRKKIILPHLDEFLNERFLGQYCTSGDDRFLTNVVLKKGYKTFYQSTGLTYTNCPDTFVGFIKQQLRWARSSQRETLLSLKWLPKYPFTMLLFLTDMITPFFFLAVEINSLYKMLTYGIKFITLSQMFIDIFFLILAMNASIGLRQIHHLRRRPVDLFLLPLYTLFIVFIMTPLRIYGFFTMADQKWMSRDVIWSDGTVKSKETYS